MSFIAVTWMSDQDLCRYPTCEPIWARSDGRRAQNRLIPPIFGNERKLYVATKGFLPSKSNMIESPRNDKAAADEHRDRLESGIKTFAALFSRLMDMNEFSHPTMVKLAHGCMYGVSWLHSSQISGLRHGKLISPGPRTFVAIQTLNFYLHRYVTEKKLLPGTNSSNDYRNAYAITEGGEAPSVGWWVEIFCGLRKPTDIDLYSKELSASQAKEKSHKWAKLMRELMMTNKIDIISDLDSTLRAHYPARDAERLIKIKAVLTKGETWTSDEFALELPAITAFSASLGGPDEEEAFVE